MADPIVLRPYQLESVEALRAGMRAGHRAQVLMAPTGAGKTEIGAYLCDEVNKKGRRAAFVVDRVNLVDQTSQRFDKYGIPHGVIQADHWRRRGYERIQICSAQTLEKRGFFPDLDLLIVDECHATRRETTRLIQNRADLRVIGLSATPFTKGLSQIYTNLVNVTTTNKLIADNWLVPLQVYAARAVDMTGAKVVAGEWSDKEIEQRGMAIIGDIVSEWIDKTRLHFGGPVKTIVFSATVEHGAELCRQFNEQGFNFQQISYRDGSDERRRELIEEFRKPDSEIHGLVSCEVFTKGFDVSDILCGIAARPYRKSLSSHIQQLGRVMRPAPGKTFGLWLDHCGNALRFGVDTARIFEHGLDRLDDGDLDSKVRKEPSLEEKKQITCAACGFVLPPSCTACPACGKERERRSLIENVAGVMEVVSAVENSTAKGPDYLRDKASVWRQLCGLAIERKNGDTEKARKFALAQFKSLYGHWPKADFSVTDVEPPSRELKGKVQSLLIKRAHQLGRSANAVR
ncbi:DEAD/DEAH box helicase family protein [Burkholderia multivorans]|uniref:DEAD/DEAH box helicase family protein n=1 Tax=Burkholderia multivorans TaxID=87883 RepID=UPI001C22745C|nr:DEAD/DEAH box helicase family protein [Burkholderia multivorans]MBU9648320.1 DEAD/DEAH box helicase family protein [Burkholderia multivorans]